MPQFIDLSIPITNDVISDPPVMRPQISYMTHENTWEQIAMFFPGLTKDDLPDGEGWAVESLTLSTHNGTHMDAPWHFHSTTDGGASPAPSIDEAPLDLFFAPVVKLDFSHLPAGHVVNAAEVEAEPSASAIHSSHATLFWCSLVPFTEPITSPTKALAWGRKQRCI